MQYINKNALRTFSFTFENKEYDTSPSREQLVDRIINLLENQRIDLNVNAEQKESNGMNR